MGIFTEQEGDSNGPGKFEGEPTFVPALWDLVIEGFVDMAAFDGDTPVDIIVIDEALVAKFPDLEGTYAVALWESEQGFVYHRTLESEEAYQQLLADLEGDADDDTCDEDGGREYSDED